uniref:Prolactin releasing hormone 2 n=1 Tax=Salarias fasciatus TaxID=181472 RepID=A0A672FBA3_SALFA
DSFKLMTAFCFLSQIVLALWWVFARLSHVLFCCPHRSGPDIDASWYASRGVRPVGRFGRKVLRSKQRLTFIPGRVYRPVAVLLSSTEEDVDG